MTKRMRVAGGGLIAAALVFVLGPVALAQYETEAGTESECAQVFDENGEPVAGLPPGGNGIFAGQAGGDRQCLEGSSFFELFFIQSETRIASGTADADGSYFVSFQIPLDADASRGASLELRGTGPDGGFITYSRTIDVLAAAAPARRGAALPLTGSRVAGLAIWATILIIGGSVLIAATWRRYRESKIVDDLDGDAFGPLAIDMDESDLADLRPTFPTAEPHTARSFGRDDAEDTGELDAVEPPADDREPVLVGATLGDVRQIAGGADDGFADDGFADGPLDQRSDEPLDVVRSDDEPVSAAEPVDEVVEQATRRTSDIVNRLQEEIAAWSEPR